MGGASQSGGDPRRAAQGKRRGRAASDRRPYGADGLDYGELSRRRRRRRAAVLKSVRHEIGVVLIWINITSEQETHGHAKGEEDGIQAGLERRAV